MSSAGWDEIKRLARDLQRVQLAEATQRLSERNCIEIVGKLMELKLIDVIYTTDGKEYITPVELGKEIREELIVQQGRIDLTQLQQTLNVDFSHIEAKVNELTRNDRNLTLVLGQLVDRGYLDRLSEEINEKLIEEGIVSVADLTKIYDLPADFIHEMIQDRLGTIVKAVRDDVVKNVYYTQRLIDTQTSCVRGVLSAITRPTAVGTIISRYSLLPHFFFSILDRLMAEGSVVGSLSGGRTERSVFIPECYTRAQTEWIDNFYRQNGYLEYDTLGRLGISDGKAYIKKRMKTFGDVEFLESCCIGQAVTQRLEAELDEALSTGSWFDAMPILPSVCSTADAGVILQTILKARQQQQQKQQNSAAAVLCTENIVVGEDLITRCRQSFDEILRIKAEETVRENPSILLAQYGSQHGQQQTSKTRTNVDTATTSGKGDDGDQKKKKAGGGKRVAMGGREVKTKPVNKKKQSGVARVDDELDDDDVDQREEIEFMSVREVEQTLRDCNKNPYLRDCPDELIRAIAQRLYRPLSKEYGEQLKSVFLQTIVHKDQPDTAAAAAAGSDSVQEKGSSSAAADGAAGKKKSRSSELMTRIASLWTNIKIYEKSLKLFNDELEQIISRYLVQTVCTELVDSLILYHCPDDSIILTVTSDIDKPLTTEARTKLLSVLPEGRLKTTINKLLATLMGKSVGECLTYIEAISMMGDGQLQHSLKKPDKKKERQLIFNHRQALAEQLRAEDPAASSRSMDPALMLHMCVVLLVQTVSQCMLHAPGRSVPLLVTYLQPHLPPEQHEKLTRAQELVLKFVKLNQAAAAAEADKETASEERNTLVNELNEVLNAVKNISLTTKKSIAAASPTLDE